jgi:hypothetical protein
MSVGHPHHRRKVALHFDDTSPIHSAIRRALFHGQEYVVAPLVMAWMNRHHCRHGITSLRTFNTVFRVRAVDETTTPLANHALIKVARQLSDMTLRGKQRQARYIAVRTVQRDALVHTPIPILKRLVRQMLQRLGHRLPLDILLDLGPCLGISLGWLDDVHRTDGYVSLYILLEWTFKPSPKDDEDKDDEDRENMSM